MKTVYRIYKYESRNEIIPRRKDGFYLPSDIEEAVMANNSKGDNHMYDNKILETEDKATAEVRFASLEPYTVLSNSSYIDFCSMTGKAPSYEELVNVAAYSLVELEIEIDEDGTPTGCEDVIDETWKFGELIVEDAIDALLDMLREDWELRCAVIDDFITTCDENHTWIGKNGIPTEIDDEDADTYIDVLDAELVSAIARNINKLTVAKSFTEFANLCKRVIADDEDDEG